MKPIRWVAALLVLTSLVAAGFYYYAANGLPFPVNVPIHRARLLEPDRIGVLLECGRDAGATVIEDDTTVTIHAYLEVRPGDCGTEAWVDLERPLADRALFDGHTDQEIVVE